MKMKQKLVMIAVFFGVSVAFSALLSPIALADNFNFDAYDNVNINCATYAEGTKDAAEDTAQDAAEDTVEDATEEDIKAKEEACKQWQKDAEAACSTINKDTPPATKEGCEKIGLGTSGGQRCAGVKTSIIGGKLCDEKGEGGVIFGLLKWVLNIMTAGVGVAAVGGIGYGALLYTTAESKPEQTKKAIGIITNVVIGIVAYALMAVLLNFVIPGGVFS